MSLLLPFAGCLAFHEGPMPGEPKDATFAEVAGARVRYLDAGPRDAPAVVLLHGFASSLDTWLPVLPALERGHRVLALDLKGFGWTDRPEGDYSPEAQAKLVLALMDARGIHRAAVVGHSWGASIALAMALAAPERVDRLVLYDGWMYEEQLPTFFHWSRAGGVGELLFALYYDQRPDEKMELAFYDRRFVTEELVEAVEKALERPGTKAAALAAVRGQRFVELQTRYRTVVQPTLLLWGREDKVSPLAYGERLSKELPNARLVIFPQCGHFPMIEAQAPSTRELVDFLSEREVRR
ncbi:MAG TPA: alpha/beta fold hydrolase [Myxococcales bacterium]|nr:alpha/beta fold hydrolase [Myxococcales bacterium]